MLTPQDYTQFKKLAAAMRAINHKLRQQLFNYISERTCTVTELYIHFRLEQSVASQHLAVLRKSGWVKTKRQGKRIFYSVNTQTVNQYQQLASNIFK